ncbi:MAG: 2-oxoacid:acceptor oxidoreductase family protein [Symbiobacteriaceae bacterium]|nr:2-oxoacid:acceptor oxidoreductase family protein [Symbiobacteriaceae bacterium]
MIKEVRLHGRGGMGTVKAAEVLVYAAVKDGKFGNSIPFFGFERQGAPVTAFLRLSDNPIRPKTKVYTPEIVLVMDATIMHGVDVCEGIHGEALLVLNSPADNLPQLPEAVKQLVTVDATAIALELLGRPLVNTAMLGAFVRATGLVSLAETAAKAAELWGEKNAVCVRRGYDEAMIQKVAL